MDAIGNHTKKIHTWTINLFFIFIKFITSNNGLINLKSSFDESRNTHDKKLIMKKSPFIIFFSCFSWLLIFLAIWKKTIQNLLRRDAWIFLATIVFLNTIYAASSQNASFGQYIGFMSISILGFSPILLFTWLRKSLLTKQFSKKYLLLWSLTFFAIPAVICALSFMTQSINFLPAMYVEDGILPIIWIVLMLLDITLYLSKYFGKKIARSRQLYKINLDKSLLFITLFFGVLFGGIATSNLDKFDGNSLPMSDFISFFEILGHPLKFVSFSAQFILAFSTLYGLYWINRNILIHQLLKIRGFFVYILGVIGTATLMFPIAGFILANLPISRKYISLLPSANLDILNEANFLVPFVFMLISSPVILVIDWFDQNSKITSLAKEKVQKELEFLKTQINPHFFFNTLNNLYALSLQQSEQTPEVIMQLSDLMRYVIYKGKEDYVSVGEEMEYVLDYVQLQRLRHHKKLDFKFDNRLTDTSIPMPPILYIVLVENAFKHGVEKVENDAFIHMTIENEDDNLFFTITNSREEEISTSMGIGLQNLKRRLDLLYPDQYSLEFTEDIGIFKA